MKNDVEQGAVDAQFAVVLDEAQLAEAIHEEAHAGAGCAYHFRQCLLAYLGNHRFRRAFLAELREQQQRPSQAFFAGIEKLVHQVFLDASVASEQIRYENLRKQLFFVEHARHLFSFNLEQGCRGNSRCGGHALRLNSSNAFLSQEVPNPEQGDGCFLATLRENGELDPAFLNIKHGVRRISLGKDGLALFEIHDCPSQAALGQECVGLKSQPLRARCAEGFH